ncbi:MAG: cell wall metabolism sensor histidine kinase WalK, partial [Elusimicrobiota bacterium]|nr:cell wall metabolism sensor histidine kinase WalK [Elusimicrobiota bacterium]
IKRLAGLVGDLKTLTYIEWNSAPLNKSVFDLGLLLKTTAQEFSATAAKKGIVLKLNLIESPIKADYDRLKQVFINILSNAVQYTDSGSVNITLIKTQKQQSNYEIAVSDTGIGISEEALPHIFERFYRADKSRSRNTGGSGIGLAVAAAIVSAHNGTIKAVSGKTGTVFTITL